MGSLYCKQLIVRNYFLQNTSKGSTALKTNDICLPQILNKLYDFIGAVYAIYTIMQ